MIKLNHARTKLQRLLTMLVSVVTLAACTADNTVPGAIQATSAPILGDACTLAEQFLKGWEANDYVTMYGLISPKSLQYSQAQFTGIYQDAEKVMSAPKKSHTLSCDNAVQQGTTVAISYDMNFDSQTLGKFSDPGRTMRLIWTARGWRVAWSTMDLFEGIAGGATLQLSYTPSTRGTIYDRNGKPFAQDNQTLYLVTLLTASYPHKPEDCFIEIATLFRRFYSEVLTTYKGLTGLQYAEAVGHLDQSAYDAHHAELEAACNVKYQSQTTRVYYNNGLAAQTIGYVGAIPGDQADKYIGYPQGALVGRDGIEQKFEKELTGAPGVSLTIKLPDGTPIRTLVKQTGQSSQDVTLTLDRNLQAAAEQAIVDSYNYAAPSWAQFSTGAAAIVIDVKTGQILAIASYPTFDVDVFNTNTLYPAQTDQKLLNQIANPPIYAHSSALNLATQEYSALGSVFKIVSMVAAVDSKTFNASDIYNCTGRWDGQKQFGDTLVRTDWIALDPGYKDVGNKHGPITLTQALTSSCDAYFWQVGGVLNQKDSSLLANYAKKMGLGQPTGFTDLPELNGQIPSPENISAIEGRSWSVGDALNEVIGQGDVKVTVLQVGRMMAAVANGGTLWRPYLVQKVGSGDKTTYVAPAPVPQGNLGLTAGVLGSVQEGLCGVTQNKLIGTAQWFMWNWNFSQIGVCGKTGTAQTGTAHPNGWFAAFAGPNGKAPEIAVVALVEHGREGSETAGPIVRRIIESYYHIPFNPFPPFWSQPYQEMVDPNAVSDGGRHDLSSGK
jgi:penicillin-binding protein 2